VKDSYFFSTIKANKSYALSEDAEKFKRDWIVNYAFETLQERKSFSILLEFLLIEIYYMFHPVALCPVDIFSFLFPLCDKSFIWSLPKYAAYN